MRRAAPGSIVCAAILSMCVSAQVQRGSLPDNSTLHRQSSQQKGGRHDGQPQYAGDDACRSCHREKVESFHQTAHYLTSQLPARSSILGDFTPGKNILKTSNAHLYFRMDSRDDEFFQTAVEGAPPNMTSHSERFDLVVGSGTKGQTFAFWKGDELFQLPISYWDQLGWVNSPGYRDGLADFDRPIVPRCLECHATYFQSLAPATNRYKKTNFVAGISCEKCHGPGREHIQQYSWKSAAPGESAIANPVKFSRARQIDLCSWCHAGAGISLAPAFSYKVGQPLEQYIELPPPDPDPRVDVHGSQVQLLEKSRCFQSSTMTCETCHDIHAPQHDAAAFSKHCLGCHKAENCGLFPKFGNSIAANCVGCHMPDQQTNLIVFDVNGNKARPRMRNHWIKVYPETSPAE